MAVPLFFTVRPTSSAHMLHYWLQHQIRARNKSRSPAPRIRLTMVSRGSVSKMREFGSTADLDIFAVTSRRERTRAGKPWRALVPTTPRWQRGDGVAHAGTRRQRNLLLLPSWIFFVVQYWGWKILFCSDFFKCLPFSTRVSGYLNPMKRCGVRHYYRMLWATLLITLLNICFSALSLAVTECCHIHLQLSHCAPAPLQHLSQSGYFLKLYHFSHSSA